MWAKVIEPVICQDEQKAVLKEDSEDDFDLDGEPATAKCSGATAAVAIG